MRLLVVEDEERLALALQRGLVAEGFVVDVRTDGPSGLDAARHGDYDAVVLDIMLPRLSGYDVVRTLRTEKNWVPVLMLSAKDGEYDQADGLDYGADDYLTKPFSFVVLLARLRALLRRGGAERAPVLVSGEIELDPALREVRRDGEVVALSPRELTLLEYFLRHPDRVIGKVELLDHVWESARDTDPNVVEVYVGYLRRKLGREVVRTVRGAGYTLRHSFAANEWRRGVAQLLQVAQAEARADGRPIVWVSDAKGFRFSRRSDSGKGFDHFAQDPQLHPRQWQSPKLEVRVEPRQKVVLNAEWINPPLQLTLSDGFNRLSVLRDGAGRISVQ